MLSLSHKNIVIMDRGAIVKSTLYCISFRKAVLQRNGAVAEDSLSEGISGQADKIRLTVAYAES